MIQQDPLDYIQHLLESKSTAKQITYKNLLDAFNILSSESKNAVEELKKKIKPSDEDVTVAFDRVNEHEFHVKIAGDLLVFVSHTNIVTFEEAHPVMQEAYIKQKEVNRYFGQIMIYNFMSDSVKYNRVNDPGYLVARLLINHEGFYLIEGEGKLSSLANKISGNAFTKEEMSLLVKLSFIIAIENDLTAPSFTQVRFITLLQKNEKTQELGAGQKIGFKMSYQSKIGVKS
jgi:hypothetical protein